MEESDSTGAEPMGDGADDRPSSSVVGSTVADLSSDLGAEMEVNTTAAAHAADWTLPAADAGRIIGGQVRKWALHAVVLAAAAMQYVCVVELAAVAMQQACPCWQLMPRACRQSGEKCSLQAT